MRVKELLFGAFMMHFSLSAVAEYRWVENTGTIETVIAAEGNTFVVVFRGDDEVGLSCYVPEKEEFQVEAVLLAATTKRKVHYWCDKESHEGYGQSLRLHRIDLK